MFEVLNASPESHKNQKLKSRWMNTLGAAAWNEISVKICVFVLMIDTTATRVSVRVGLAWSFAKCIKTLTLSSS